MRADLAQQHQSAVAELLDHRAHQHPWAAQADGWVLSRTAAGAFNLETMGRGTAEWGPNGWATTLAVVDVTDRGGWPRDDDRDLCPPGHMLRTWAAQHGGMAAAALKHPQLAGAMRDVDRGARTGIVELGTVAALGLTATDLDDWPAVDLAAAAGRSLPNETVERAATAYRQAVEAALPDQCWTQGVMVMGPVTTDVAAVLDLGRHLPERIGLGQVLAEQGLWNPPPVSGYPIVRVESRADVDLGQGRLASELVEPEAASHWSVYGVRADGSVDWFADFTDLHQAKRYVSGWDRPIELRTPTGTLTADPKANRAGAGATVDLRDHPMGEQEAAAAVVSACSAFETARRDFLAADTARDRAFTAAAQAGHSIQAIAGLAGLAPATVTTGIQRANQPAGADPTTTSDALAERAASVADRAEHLAHELNRPTVLPAVPTRAGASTATAARARGHHR